VIEAGEPFFYVPRIVRVELPAGLKLVTLNDRFRVPLDRAFYLGMIRDEAYQAASRQAFTSFEVVRMRVIYHAPDNRRRDFVSGNLALSVKAAIDGIVKAGVIPDDNDAVIMECTTVRGQNVPGGQLVVQVIDAGEHS
jgi:crossover junction endodeoxyribonuclease RusA